MTFGSADGTGAAARFYGPAGMTADASGNFYVADNDNNEIREITPAGVVTTIAGSAGPIGYLDGTGSAARFNLPAGVAADSAGNLYVADTGNNVIRKISPAEVVTTLAGAAPTLVGTNAGDSDGTGSAAKFSEPSGIVADSAGNLYVADKVNCEIRKITPAGVVTTLAGQSQSDGIGLSGSADGTGPAARFNYPLGITIDSAGNLYVADTGNSIIRKVTPEGVVTTIAGTAGNNVVADGTGAAAGFDGPTGIAIDSAGNLYVMDANSLIRKITPAGVVTTIAGTTVSYLQGQWNPTSVPTEIPGAFGIVTTGVGGFVFSAGNAIFTGQGF